VDKDLRTYSQSGPQPEMNIEMLRRQVKEMTEMIQDADRVLRLATDLRCNCDRPTETPSETPAFHDEQHPQQQQTSVIRDREVRMEFAKDPRVNQVLIRRLAGFNKGQKQTFLQFVASQNAAKTKLRTAEWQMFTTTEIEGPEVKRASTAICEIGESETACVSSTEYLVSKPPLLTQRVSAKKLPISPLLIDSRSTQNSSTEALTLRIDMQQVQPQAGSCAIAANDTCEARAIDSTNSENASVDKETKAAFRAHKETRREAATVSGAPDYRSAATRRERQPADSTGSIIFALRAEAVRPQKMDGERCRHPSTRSLSRDQERMLGKMQRLDTLSVQRNFKYRRRQYPYDQLELRAYHWLHQ